MRHIELVEPDPLTVGNRVKVKQPLQPRTVWTVTELVPQHRFAWRTERPGLSMTAEHLIEEVVDGCRNTLSLEVAGTRAGLVTALLGAAMRWSIRQENDGFKHRAERR